MKRSKHIFYTASLCALLMGLASCEDWIDRPPRDSIGNESYWLTPKDFENYTLQYYPRFPAFGNQVHTYTGIMGYDAFHGSDHAITGTTPNSTLNGTEVASGTNGEWGWGDIRSVNIFFDNLAKSPVARKEIRHFIGEAYFFRAWFYFEKVKNFGDVPWYTSAMHMDSPELYRKRDPRNVVIDSILVQLDSAATHLTPIHQMTALGGTNRLSREIALAFKSRVALFEGTWEKYHNGTDFGVKNADWNKYFRIAVAAAEEIMNNTATNKIAIYNKNKPAEDYAYIFGQDDMSAIPEIMLWKKHDVDLGLGNQLQPFVSGFTATISVTENLVRNYLSKTGTVIDYNTLLTTKKGNEFLTELGTQADNRLSQTIWIPGALLCNNANGLKTFGKPALSTSANGFNGTGYQLRKGVNPLSPTTGGPSTTLGNTGGIIFRYAEVLLNYAEAKAELGEAVDYDKSLNLLRKRAGMPNFDKNFTDASRQFYADFGYTLSNELYEIRRERAVELACEGFRKTDYRRWAAGQLFKDKRPKGYPFLQSEWGSTKINTPRDAQGLMDPLQAALPNGYSFDIERDYLDYIPTNEITLNPDMTQNPKW